MVVFGFIDGDLKEFPNDFCQSAMGRMKDYAGRIVLRSSSLFDITPRTSLFIIEPFIVLYIL